MSRLGSEKESELGLSLQLGLVSDIKYIRSIVDLPSSKPSI